MNCVDAHIHLADPAYAGKVTEVLSNAKENDVTHLLSNAVDYQTSTETIKLAKQHKKTVLAAVGVHPWTVVNQERLLLDELEKMIDEHHEAVIAIGEIGLDGHYLQDEQKRNRQREVFSFFLHLAENKKLPVVVHSRMAESDVLQTLTSFNIQKVLLHWYSGPIDTLKSIADNGYFISVGPSVLYTKRTSEIARAADLEIILTETDGPVSYHGAFEGRMTQPSFVKEVVKKLALLKATREEIVRAEVWDNFIRYLGLIK